MLGTESRNHYDLLRQTRGVGEGLGIELELRPLMEIRRTNVLGLRFPVWQRPRTTEAKCMRKIFQDREYELNLVGTPSVIVDAGANAGFASV